MKHPLIRLVVVNTGIGVLASVAVVGGLLAMNAHGLRKLVFASPDGGLAVVLLVFGFVVTLCSVAIGVAVMTQATKDGGGNSGGRGTPALEPIPIPVRASVDKTRRGF